jgi:hypothetical protein
VQHVDNRAASTEEADVVAALLDWLLRGTWTDARGRRRPIRLADVLVVAPYNAHVGCLRARLPSGARVGTVDRFQGQEAAVVLYSMATSTADEAPRGMQFLFNLNRLNVAVSRARALVAVIASPRLLDAAVRRPEELRMANALCRLAEAAGHVVAPARLWLDVAGPRACAALAPGAARLERSDRWKQALPQPRRPEWPPGYGCPVWTDARRGEPTRPLAESHCAGSRVRRIERGQPGVPRG